MARPGDVVEIEMADGSVAEVAAIDDSGAPRRRIGPYEILRTLGRGGMAEVFLARRQDIAGVETDVALKVIYPHLSSDPQFTAMFFDEARVAARVHDARVVRIHELGVAGGTYFIAMEYLEGCVLADLFGAGLRGGTWMPPPLVARVFVDVAGGLHAVHEARDANGIPLEAVHRDISLSNIMVLRSGHAKVIDFGVVAARTRSTVTSPGERKGKSGYMSPEQARGEPVDRRSDVFSCGVALWQLLARRRLFEGADDVETMRLVETLPAPAPSSCAPGIAPALDAIVARALAKSPGERYQTAGELAAALEAFLATTGEPASHAAIANFLAGAPPPRPARPRVPMPALLPTGATRPRPTASDDVPTRLAPTPRRRRRRVLGPWLAAAACVAALAALAFAIGRHLRPAPTAPIADRPAR